LFEIIANSPKREPYNLQIKAKNLTTPYRPYELTINSDTYILTNNPEGI